MEFEAAHSKKKMAHHTLLDAAKRNDVAAMEAYAARGQDVFVTTTDGCSALMLAALYRKEDACAWCIQRWAAGRRSLDAVDLYGHSAVVYACSMSPVAVPDDGTCLYLLVEAGADVNLQGSDGTTALHAAARHGYLHIVSYLVSMPGCRVNVRAGAEGTPYDVALARRNRDCARVIGQERDTRIRWNPSRQAWIQMCAVVSQHRRGVLTPSLAHMPSLAGWLEPQARGKRPAVTPVAPAPTAAHPPPPCSAAGTPQSVSGPGVDALCAGDAALLDGLRAVLLDPRCSPPCPTQDVWRLTSEVAGRVALFLGRTPADNPWPRAPGVAPCVLPAQASLPPRRSPWLPRVRPGPQAANAGTPGGSSMGSGGAVPGVASGTLGASSHGVFGLHRSGATGSAAAAAAAVTSSAPVGAPLGPVHGASELTPAASAPATAALSLGCAPTASESPCQAGVRPRPGSGSAGIASAAVHSVGPVEAAARPPCALVAPSRLEPVVPVGPCADGDLVAHDSDDDQLDFVY